MKTLVGHSKKSHFYPKSNGLSLTHFSWKNNVLRGMFQKDSSGCREKSGLKGSQSECEELRELNSGKNEGGARQTESDGLKIHFEGGNDDIW